MPDTGDSTRAMPEDLDRDIRQGLHRVLVAAGEPQTQLAFAAFWDLIAARVRMVIERNGWDFAVKKEPMRFGEVAEDVEQGFRIHLWETVSKWREEGRTGASFDHPVSYLVRMVHNYCDNVRKRAPKTVPLDPEIVDPVDLRPNPEQAVTDAAVLHQLVQELPKMLAKLERPARIAWGLTKGGAGNLILELHLGAVPPLPDLADLFEMKREEMAKLLQPGRLPLDDYAAAELLGLPTNRTRPKVQQQVINLREKAQRQIRKWASSEGRSLLDMLGMLLLLVNILVGAVLFSFRGK